MKVIWTKTANQDLHELAKYWLDIGSSQIATNTIERIVAATAKLTTFPNIGKQGRVAGTRELVVPNMPYIIAYSVNEQVNILRIVHTSRFW